MKYLKARAGYSFIEAIIAVTILSALIVLAINLTTSSADSGNNNRDYLVSDLLAQQANELVESLYKTNVIKFGTQKISQCGLMLPTYTGTGDQCNLAANSTKKLGIGKNYIVSQNTDNVIVFSGINTDLINEATNVLNETYRVYELDEAEGGIFDQAIAQPENSELTKYYRQIQISGTVDNLQVEVTIAWLGPGGTPIRNQKKFNLSYV